MLKKALEKIDQANLQDPNQSEFEGRLQPKEYVYSQHMTRWLFALQKSPSELMQIACRAQHSLMTMMYNPPHPSELLQETIDELGISARKLAQALDVAPSTVQRILSQKVAISPDMALRLSVVIGSSAQVWLGMQDSYDLWHAKEGLDLSRLHKLQWV